MSRAFILATLTRLGACDDSPDDALPWARALPEDTTPEQAWYACERGDWLVWLLGKLHVAGLLAREVLVLAACAAARTALPHLVGHVAHAPALAAIETAERWTRGEATVSEVREAANAADDAYLDAAIAAHATVHAADATCLDATLAACATAHAADAAASFRLACPSAYAENAASRAADAACSSDAYAAAYAAAYEAADAAVASNGAHARAQRLVEIGVAVRSVVPWRTVAAALGDLSAPGTA